MELGWKERERESGLVETGREEERRRRRPEDGKKDGEEWKRAGTRLSKEAGDSRIPLISPQREEKERERERERVLWT